MSLSVLTPFLFGKLPSHGDFVQRGLCAADVRRWDDWASEGMEAAAQGLSPGFEEAYATAPPWRFVMRWGEGWRTGAFAASLDRAGRRFPIVAGLAVAERSAGAAEIDLEALAAGAEDAIYAAFGGAQDADALLSRLGALSARPAAQPPFPRAWTLGGERHAPATRALDRLEPTLLAVALAPGEGREAAA